MQPVMPVRPDEVQAPEAIVIFCGPGVCEHDPKHIALPVLMLHDRYGSVVTRWQFTDDERTQIAAGADLYLYIDLGGRGVPPMLPTLIGPRFGHKCTDCSHGRTHDRVVGALAVGCRFCDCVSGWREPEGNPVVEQPIIEARAEPDHVCQSGPNILECPICAEQRKAATNKGEGNGD